jgi:hypothetical protein
LNIRLAEMQQEAQLIIKDCSRKIEEDLCNVFVFAHSLPVQSKFEVEQIQFNNIEQSQEPYIELLSQSMKEIYLKTEVLSKDFLSKFKELGSKVLHLSPGNFRIGQNQTFMSIEDDEFNELQISANDLKDLLELEIGKLTVVLVIIEMPDCEDFCKVFKDLGVPHVLSFSTSSYNIK